MMITVLTEHGAVETVMYDFPMMGYTIDKFGYDLSVVEAAQNVCSGFVGEFEEEKEGVFP